MSLAKLKANRPDTVKEAEGVWATYTADGETMFRLKLAFAGGANERYMKRSEEMLRPFRRSGVDLDTVAVERQRQISGDLFAETIVTDWNADDFGEAFNVESCKEAFRIDPGLLAFCVREANKAVLYRIEGARIDAGN